MFATWFSAKTVAPLALKIAGHIAEAATDPAMKKVGQFKVSLQIGFDKYIRHQIKRYSKTKTIIRPNSPLALKDIYINLFLTEDRVFAIPTKHLRDDDFIPTTGESKRIIFTATAGAGKTMLLRYLFLQTLSNNEDVLPIFLELRDLNDYPDKSIFDFILDSIREQINNFTHDQLKYAIREGFIVLFLDGFDEIDYDKANKRAKEIINLSDQYDKMSLFMTSRIEESFQSWEGFEVFRLTSLSEDQVKLLVHKIPYDAGVKAIFDKQLAQGLYASHKEPYGQRPSRCDGFNNITILC